MDAGITLNPETPVESIEKVAPLCDMVLVMSVNPGFGGQGFIETSVAKIAKARAYLPESVAIEVDGGVTALNAAGLVAAGANLLVAGSSVFGGHDIGGHFAELAQAAGEAV